MIKVGVTGGIGAGKTTFCKTWEHLGAFVVYMDDFAKRLMVTDKKLITNITHAFGKESYLQNGDLNTVYLADKAFAKGRIEELNTIIHPCLRKKMDELAQRKEADGVKIFVKEAAILLQKGRPIDTDYIVLLYADQSNRIARVKRRDNITYDLIIDRINKQEKFNEIKHLADYVVSNNKNERELVKKAADLFRILISQN